MKTSGFKSLLLGAASVLLLGAFATPTRADFIQTFNLENVQGFDSITATIVNGNGAFVAPGFSIPSSAGWTVATGTPSVISASGSSIINELTFGIEFNTADKIVFTLEALNSGLALENRVVDRATLTWDQGAWSVDQQIGNSVDVVPEPSTLVAAMLLLAPLSVSAMRLFRPTKPE